MINLLPPQFKEELKQEENFKLILILAISVLIFLISLILVLFSIKIYLQGQISSQEIILRLEEKKFQTPEIRNLQKKTSQLNQNLFQLKSFYQDQTALTEIIGKISQSLPDEIYLTRLSITPRPEKEKAKLNCVISGFSPNREALFEFKENLGKEERWFEEVYFPPSNWVKPADINFSATFEIKK